MEARAEVTEALIAARLERLPVSRWHLKLRAILGIATFFDAFDSLAIAFVLPALIGPWHIGPQAIGFLISIGYAGQALGALGCGWLADRVGRIKAATAAVLVFGVMSLACAAAQNYEQLFWCRFVSGIGLGGEVPIAATYISEIARARGRGRFFLLYEMVFQVGLVMVASVAAWIAPRFGWQSLFLIGGIPAIVAVFIRRGCPESPRWLAARGRLAEADDIVSGLEEATRRSGHTLAPIIPIDSPLRQAPMRFRELFGGPYRRRTLVVWMLWASAYLVGYGTTTWLPSLYRSGFDLPLQTALNYGIVTSVSGFTGAALCTFLIDRTGRRTWFAGAFPDVGALPCDPRRVWAHGRARRRARVGKSFRHRVDRLGALPLYAGTLPDADARDRRQRRDVLVAARLHLRAARHRAHRSAFRDRRCLRAFRVRRRPRRRHLPRLRDGDTR